MLEESRDLEITLNLLSELEKNAELSQRQLAKKVGIALGATNARINQLIKDGLLKKVSIDKRCGSYEVTPKGVVRKSSLFSNALSHSLEDFFLVKHDLDAVFGELKKQGFSSVYLYGKGHFSDLAELVLLQYSEQIKCLGIVYNEDDIIDENAAILFVELKNSLKSYHNLSSVFGLKRIFIPSILKNTLIFKGE